MLRTASKLNRPGVTQLILLARSEAARALAGYYSIDGSTSSSLSRISPGKTSHHFSRR
jgi:hypothetical protein